MGEELSGVGGPPGSLAEPLQGGLEKRLLAVMLNLVMKRGAQILIMVASEDLTPHLSPPPKHDVDSMMWCGEIVLSTADSKVKNELPI